jgi:hypothetical protein
LRDDIYAKEAESALKMITEEKLLGKKFPKAKRVANTKLAFLSSRTPTRRQNIIYI